MNTSRTLRGLGLAAVVLLAQAVALAEKPEWAGNGNGKNKREEERRDGRQEQRYDERRQPAAGGAQIDIRIGGYFGDTQRRAVHDHYDSQARGGHCPPGLAKKNNGCLPPGQARKWALGQPLPRDVVYYPLEPGISVRLGVPPAGYKYVRVASDILLIAVGTGIVVDAIKDLGRP